LLLEIFGKRGKYEERVNKDASKSKLAACGPKSGKRGKGIK
jgi:hypothetical protein